MIKKALISVWDKEGLIELAQFLVKHKVEIISTGGTAKYLEDNNIEVTPVSSITGMGAVMDGRVKTLNPKIFGGILADRGNPDHLDALKTMGGQQIDLIIVNLYPFVQEAVKNNLPMEKAIEFIDIGGPSMLRAAAKNYHSVSVLSDTQDYQIFMDNFKDNDISLDCRKTLAAKVFQRTSEYDYNITQYFNKGQEDQLPDSKNIYIEKVQDLRYGENPHQSGAFYINKGGDLPFKKYQGKALSYNNYLDLESAYNIANEFESPACAIIKHSNPCGFALGGNLLDSYQKAVTCDPISYFGGIVSFNGEVTSGLAEELVKPFLECIIAPSFTEDALKIFSKKKNLRVLSMPKNSLGSKYEIKSVSGGYLAQEKDSFKSDFDNLKVVTKKEPNQNEIEALKLGWKLVRYVKSNAIVIANNNQILGVGAGQMSRIDSVKIAIRKIKEFNLSLDGAIMASDAFFPFSDCVEIANEHGIKSIIQPGGSIKDDEVIKVANELDLSMVFTSIRHFYH